MPLHASPIEFNSSIQSNQRKEKFLLAVDMVVTKSHKRKKACSPMSCTLLLIVYLFVFLAKPLFFQLWQMFYDVLVNLN